MKISSAFAISVSCIVIFSCISRKKLAHANPFPPDQVLTIDFYPSWGGSAEAVLERKNGKDNLYSTYHQKVNGIDTILTAKNFANASTADSVFSLAAKVKWNADANHGTAETRVGLKFNMSLKTGWATKSVSWENLKSARELPEDILSVVKIVNRISPDDFKIY